MTEPSATTWTFGVHARRVDAQHARTIEEPSLKAAAATDMEHLHELPEAGCAVSVVVRDVETGHEHMFKVDVDAGEAHDAVPGGNR